MAGKGMTWGETKVFVGGQELLIAPKATANPGGKKRNEVQADYQSGLYNNETVSSEVKLDIIVNGDFRIADTDVEDATVIFELDTGQTFVMNHAYRAEPPELSDGKGSLMFRGAPLEELTA